MKARPPIKTFDSPLSRLFFCNPSLPQHNLTISSQLLTKRPQICLLIYNHEKPMSIFPSFRLFPSKTPSSLHQYPNLPNLNTLKFPFFPITPAKLFFIKPITIQRIPTKPILSTPSASPSATLQPIEELPPQLQEIIRLFQAVEEPKAKYEQLLFYGKNLKPLDAQFKTIENKVQGCVSQVWVRAFHDSDKNVIFEADSDSVLTKGLAALLVQGLSGRTVEEIVRVSPDFVVLLGLQHSLTPSRNNGFLNMLNLMKKKALQLYMEGEKDSNSGSGFPEISAENANQDLGSNGNGVVKNGMKSEAGAGNLKLESGDNSSVQGSRRIRIKEKLEKELNPMKLEVEDVSYQHAGHAGVEGSGGETHFNLTVVSREFEGKSLVKRHRLIYKLLQEELQTGLHALSIDAKTPSEVDSRRSIGA